MERTDCFCDGISLNAGFHLRCIDSFYFLLCGCVGETGIGKSTLMDTLFNTKFESDPATHNEPGVRLKARSYELQESNVRLKLTIVDTVGFGDQINKDDRYIILRFYGRTEIIG